jgi:equilibrative nucleoside transporter 1/2/3
MIEFIFSSGGSLTWRITISILVEVLIFVVTVGLAMVDSSSWPGVFFYVTMALVVVLNMANGVYQNCVYGTAAKLPMRFTNAVVLGSNISGTLTSIINLVAIALAPSPRTAAIYYFLAAILVLLVCFDTYFALPLCVSSWCLLLLQISHLFFHSAFISILLRTLAPKMPRKKGARRSARLS